MSLGSKELKNLVNSASCILLDIEGTTTSVDFVRKDMMHYAYQNVQDFVVSHWDDSEVQKVIEQLKISDYEDEVKTTLKKLSGDQSKPSDISDLQWTVITKLKVGIKYLKCKVPVLKEIVSLVCLDGFIKGDLVGHIYPDVVEALKSWTSQEKRLYIYSNGIVRNQQFLFQQSIHGDLSKYIDGYFDLAIGCKLEQVSYSKICQDIGKLPNEIVFFSDRPKELLAASQAGLNIVLVVRKPEQLLYPEEMCNLKPTDPIINSFLDVLNN